MRTRCRRSVRAVARAVLVCGLCLSVGVQWIVLQGVAWTGMLISFSKDGTILEAMGKTFDGAHPCPLCCAVQQGQSETDDPESTDVKKQDKKQDAVLFARQALVPPAPGEMIFIALVTPPAESCAQPCWEPPRA